MADYVGRTLSNSVKVKDVNKFIEVVKGIESNSTISFETDLNKSEVMFYCGGVIHLENEGPEIIEAMQELISDDSTLVIKEIGYEKFAYLYSDAYIISSKCWTRLDFDETIQNSMSELKRPRQPTSPLKIISIDTTK